VSPGDDRGAPRQESAAKVITSKDTVPQSTDGGSSDIGRRLDHALRLFWLAEVAERYDAAAVSRNDAFCAWLAAQLRDLRDLLEAAKPEGWES
jgi:hypothetical protein